MTQLLDGRPLCIPETTRSLTRAQRSGKEHEYAMHLSFEEKFGELYLPSPWFRYQVEWSWKYCQADGLLFLPATGSVVICEAKLAHTFRAYRQLSKLYRPVVQSLFPRWTVCLLEVVRWYRDTMLDRRWDRVPVELVSGAQFASPDYFNVLILKGDRNERAEV